MDKEKTMDEAFELTDEDFASLAEPERTSSWLASFDDALVRAGVPGEDIRMRHTVDNKLLDDPRVNTDLRERASMELLDNDAIERLANALDRAEDLRLAWLATLVKWAAQYEVLAAVGRLDEAVFLKVASYAMNAMGLREGGKPVVVTGFSDAS